MSTNTLIKVLVGVTGFTAGSSIYGMIQLRKKVQMLTNEILTIQLCTIAGNHILGPLMESDEPLTMEKLKSAWVEKTQAENAVRYKYLLGLQH